MNSCQTHRRATLALFAAIALLCILYLASLFGGLDLLFCYNARYKANKTAYEEPWLALSRCISPGPTPKA